MPVTTAVDRQKLKEVSDNVEHIYFIESEIRKVDAAVVRKARFMSIDFSLTGKARSDLVTIYRQALVDELDAAKGKVERVKG